MRASYEDTLEVRSSFAGLQGETNEYGGATSGRWPGKRTLTAELLGPREAASIENYGGESTGGAPGAQRPARSASRSGREPYEVITEPNWHIVGGATSSLRGGYVNGNGGGMSVRASVLQHDSGFQVGYLQTVVASTRTYIYRDAHGAERQRFTTQIMNAMDQDTRRSPPAPWYDHPSTGDGVVEMRDIPHFRRSPRARDDQSAILKSMAGHERFITWLVALQQSGTPRQLRWCSWEIDWTGEFSADHGRFSGGHARVTGRGRSSHGMPVTAGAPANAIAPGVGEWSAISSASQAGGATSRRRSAHAERYGGERDAAPAQDRGADEPSPHMRVFRLRQQLAQLDERMRSATWTDQQIAEMQQRRTELAQALQQARAEARNHPPDVRDHDPDVAAELQRREPFPVGGRYSIDSVTAAETDVAAARRRADEFARLVHRRPEWFEEALDPNDGSVIGYWEALGGNGARPERLRLYDVQGRVVHEETNGNATQPDLDVVDVVPYGRIAGRAVPGGARAVGRAAAALARRAGRALAPTTVLARLRAAVLALGLRGGPGATGRGTSALLRQAGRGGRAEQAEEVLVRPFDRVVERAAGPEVRARFPIFSTIRPTGPLRQGTSIPRSFEMTTSDGRRYWVSGAATEHFPEALSGYREYWGATGRGVQRPNAVMRQTGPEREVIGAAGPNSPLPPQPNEIARGSTTHTYNPATGANDEYFNSRGPAGATTAASAMLLENFQEAASVASARVQRPGSTLWGQRFEVNGWEFTFQPATPGTLPRITHANPRGNLGLRGSRDLPRR